MSRNRYKWFYDHLHSRYYNLLIKYCFLPLGGETRVRRSLLVPIDFSPGEKILDMCCGTGGATRAIAEKAGPTCQIVALDLSTGQIRVARRRNRLAHVRFLERDAARTGLEGESFDKVFITHALHEMPRPLRLAVLAEAIRVLVPDGQLVVFELDNPPSLLVRLFIGFWFFYWLPMNFETPTRRDMLTHGLANEVEEAGFRDVVKQSLFRGVLQIVQAVK